MRGSKAKGMRKALTMFGGILGENGIRDLCEAKFNQPNRSGDRQHRRISPMRQLKKLMMRVNKERPDASASAA